MPASGMGLRPRQARYPLSSSCVASTSVVVSAGGSWCSTSIDHSLASAAIAPMAVSSGATKPGARRSLRGDEAVVPVVAPVQHASSATFAVEEEQERQPDEIEPFDSFYCG